MSCYWLATIIKKTIPADCTLNAIIPYYHYLTDVQTKGIENFQLYKETIKICDSLDCWQTHNLYTEIDTDLKAYEWDNTENNTRWYTAEIDKRCGWQILINKSYTETEQQTTSVLTVFLIDKHIKYFYHQDVKN